MSYSGYRTLLIAVAVMMTMSGGAWSQQTTPFTPAELDELFAPIALYPDPLLAQILPAATFPDQLATAADFQGSTSLIDSQPWDVSVKAVAHYPSVLNLMTDSPDWTVAIGQAYVNQPDDVMKSIQRLRGKAKLMGYLNSNTEQTVSVSNGYISIVPTQPQYIYVPTYNPQVVYVQRRPNYGSYAIAFGAGLLIGSWLNNNIDWNRNRVYYHGWNGGGWVGRSRPRVQIHNNHYVNSGFANKPVRINPAVRTRDITPYRRDIQRNAGTYRTPGVVTPTPRTRPGAAVVTPTPRTRPGGAVVTPTPRTRRGGAVVTPTPRTRRGATVVTPTPRTRPGATVVTPTPRTRPGATVVTPTSRTRPNNYGMNRPMPTPRPGAGVATPTQRTRPGNYGLNRPMPTPRSGAGVATPTQRTRPSNAGMTRPSSGARPSGQKARSSGKARGGKADQGKSERK